MKKIIFILLILLFGMFMTSCSENPYAGEYTSSNNVILKLESNNSCMLINNVYKESFYTNGKYSIKDNNINIAFDKSEPNYYGISSLTGKFEGSSINIHDPSNNIYYIFYKK